MLFIWPHTQLISNTTMDLFETWEDQEIQFDLSIRYVIIIYLTIILNMIVK